MINIQKHIISEAFEQLSKSVKLNESKVMESNTQFDIHAVLNANGEYEDLTEIVKDPSKIIIYDTWDQMLKDRDNLHTYYIRQNGDKEYEVMKYSKWSGDQYVGYVGPHGYSSLEELYNRNPGKYDTDDVCLVKEFHIEEKLSESKLTEAPMDVKDYAARLRARKAEKDQNPLEKINSQIDPDMSITDQLQVYFDELVPASGKAKTVAGEIIRAIMRLLYRNYNDGDLWYSGYGRETCGSEVIYLINVLPDFAFDYFSRMAEMAMEDDEYTDNLEELTENIIIYLNQNPQLFTEENIEDSRRKDYTKLDDIFNMPTYDFEPDTSYDESYYAVSDDDINELLKDFIRSELGSGSLTRWARDGWTIEGLDKEDYERAIETWPDWFESFLEDHEREDEEDFEESLTKDN